MAKKIYLPPGTSAPVIKVGGTCYEHAGVSDKPPSTSGFEEVPSCDSCKCGSCCDKCGNCRDDVCAEDCVGEGMTYRPDSCSERDCECGLTCDDFNFSITNEGCIGDADCGRCGCVPMLSAFTDPVVCGGENGIVRLSGSISVDCREPTCDSNAQAAAIGTGDWGFEINLCEEQHGSRTVDVLVQSDWSFGTCLGQHGLTCTISRTVSWAPKPDLMCLQHESQTNSIKASTIEQPHGPGTELSKILSKWGVKTCGSCKGYAAKMNRWGPAECRNRIDEIADWLKDQSKKRKIPYLRIGAKMLVKKAIKRAEKNAAE